MADLNVDDEWFLADPRRDRLIALVGDAYRADGMVLAAWRLARRYWREGRKHIPEDVWEMAGLDPLREVKLASHTQDGIYVSGTRERCAYLTQKSDAGHLGGLASVRSRREKTGTAVPVNARNRPTEAPPKQTEAPQSGPEAESSRPKLTEAFTLLSCNIETSSLVGPRGPTPLDLAELWNQLKAPTQHKVITTTLKPGTERWRVASKRLRDFPDLAVWRQVITALSQSPWHTGKNPDGWAAGFDFLINTTTYQKALEGSIGPKRRSGPQVQVIDRLEDLDADS